MTNVFVTHSEESYPYSRCDYLWRRSDSNNMTPIIIDRLFDFLPHGSGIDYTWYCRQHIKNPARFSCSNSFHAMNENGMYCHVWDFTVVLDYNPQDDKLEFVRFEFNRCNPEHDCSMCGYGLRDYLEQLFWDI